MKTPIVRRFFAIVSFIAISHMAASTANAEEVSMNADKNEQIIRAFIGDWSRLDANRLVDYFAEDGTYQNMPMQPVSGHDNLQKFISGFIGGWSKTDWEIINLVSQDNIVMVERVDRTVVNGKQVDLPCVGVFEMEDGKIVLWRDYFDLATYTQALSQ